jgi:hypothetical protein
MSAGYLTAKKTEDKCFAILNAIARIPSMLLLRSGPYRE